VYKLFYEYSSPFYYIPEQSRFIAHKSLHPVGHSVIAVMLRDTIKGHLYVQMGKVCAAKWWPQSLLEETLFSGSPQNELQYDTHHTNPNNHVE
jgi:hypothetical protein